MATSVMGSAAVSVQCVSAAGRVRRVISSDALTVSDAPLTDLDLVRQIRLWYGAIEQADRPRRR